MKGERTACPEMTSQRRAVLSRPVVASCRPLGGRKTTAVTGAPCSNWASDWKVPASSTLTVPLSVPTANRAPSGVNATLEIGDGQDPKLFGLARPVSSKTTTPSLPVTAFLPGSFPPTARNLPSGLNATVAADPIRLRTSPCNGNTFASYGSSFAAIRLGPEDRLHERPQSWTPAAPAVPSVVPSGLTA